jgi:hypothetical protein
MTDTTEPLTESEIEQLRRIADEGGAVKLDNPELRAFVASLDKLQALEVANTELRQINQAMVNDAHPKPNGATFGPATDDQVAWLCTAMASGDPYTVSHAEVWQLIERIESDRVRLLDLRALAAATFPPAPVVERETPPDAPQPEPGLSPTVAIAVLAQAVWHVIDHRVGLASLAMVNGGLLREGK